MLRVCFLSLILAATPVLAQDDNADPGAPEGLDMLREGSRLLLEDFLRRLEPTLDDMQEQIADALEAFRDQIGQLDAYHPPDILPNGDIIIRRKEPLDELPILPEDEAEGGEGGAIDL